MKRISIILSLILFFVGSLMISGCADLYSNIKLIPSVNSIELEINKTATFEVEIENYTEDMLSEVFVYNENKIIKEVETTYSEGTAFIEILGLKVGEGSIFISTYEGSKKCVINAKVYQPVTGFSLKTEPYIIEEKGFALDFSETDYFNFSPANASYTDVSFFFDDNGVEKKVLSAKTIKESDDNLLVTLQTDNGQVDITTQSFAMTAKLDNYPLINAVEFDIDVIEPINVGKVNLIKRGIYNDYFAHDEMIELAQSQSLTLISNNIETAYIAFEIQVFSQNVSFEIIANNIEIEILEISPEDFEPTSPFSRFFSIQSANLGNDILEIKAFYEQYDGYEITRSFPVESISMPDKLYVNDKPEFNESVYLYDRNFGNEKSYKFDMNLTVYATDSIFESVSFSIETEAGEAFPPATHWSQYIEVKYKNRIITEDFIISYNDFLNNSLKSPISLVGKEQFDDGALRVKLELNSDLLEQEIIYYVPIIIEEGATKFEVKPLYVGGLSLDIDNGAVNFSGLSVESLTAYIGNISFEYLDNSDLYFTVEQVIINDIEIKITPLSIGQGRAKIILPNGLSVILPIKIEKVLSSAKLSVINSREISLTETDLEGNISYIAINYSYQKENQVNEEPLNIDFRLLLNPSNATLFEMSCEILEGDFVEFDTVKQVLYIRDIGTAKIKITLDLFEIVDFARESNDTKIEFEVEIESYYPLENFSFQKDEIEKISATVYKDSDVGYYYAQQGYSKIEIDLKATLFDGSNIDEVFMYYEDYISWTTELGAPNEVSSSRIGGTYSATGTIDNFGQYKITGNHLQLDCNSPFAHANTNFWIAFTISEYNVNKTAILKISILDYVPLYSVGFYNYVEEIYLSDSNSVHIFNTFMDLKSDCREFDVFFEARDATSESLISATINSSFSEVRITYNQTGTGYGTLYFIPKTSYIDKTHYNYFTSVEVWVSDGTDINNPLIINSATEFVSTMSSVEALSKHFKIASTLDFARITLPYFGEFKGSIVGATASAKLTNIKINALFSEGSNVFGGIFSKLSASAQIKNIVFEGEIAVFVTTKDNVYLGLIAGQNNGRIENVSVILKSSSATILNKSETYSQSTICIGGIVGLNAGIIKNVVDTSAKTFNHILLNQTAEMEVRYEGYSKNTYVGGIAGNNSAVITREMVDGSQLYNTSIYGAIISILSRGINATGGIAGINRNFILEGLGYINSQISGLLVNGNVSAEQHQLSTFTTLGGENVGGICGINNSYVQSCISRVQTHGYNYVGGIAGNDNSLAGYSSGGNPADFDFIKNCKVQAVYSSSFKYMLTAQSYYGKIGAISGNETTEINRDVYEFNNNSANFYYEMDASNKIFPVAYSSTGPNYENIKYNADDDYYILFRYEQMPIEIDEITPEYEFGAGKLATENSDFENKVAYMFYYDAKDNAENDYIRSFNSNRDIPFIFENSDSLILTSLSENILKITSDGKINLFGTGIATIRVSSLLNTTIDTQVYVIITNAFDKFRIIAANTYDLTTGSNVIVYKNSSVELGFEFSHSNIETRDEYHQIIWVEMKNNTDAGIDYQINESTHYIDISMTGNRLILKVNQIAGVKSTNTITFTPKFELNLSTVGKVYMNRENIEDESQNEFDSLITESEKEISIIAIAKKGTEKVGVDFTTRSAEPLDIIEIDVNQITDYEDDYLIISIVKAGEDADAPDDYFLILDYEGYEYNDNKYQYMGTSGSFRFQFNFEKYALNNFDYTGTYYINFIADNGIQQTIIITMEKQEVSGIDLKNYYNIQSIFNDTQKEENYVAVGSTNLLAVEVYPYFSDFDYIKIENDSENEINGSTLVFEVVELMEDKKLKTVFGIEYIGDAIKIPQSIIKNFTTSLTSSKIYIKYTTTSAAQIDSIARLIVSAIKFENGEEEIKFTESRSMSVIIKDKVSFSIVGRELVDGKYYVAKGLTYELDLQIHGFSEQQMKIEINPNYATIDKDGETYYMHISSSINYPTGDEGCAVEITTYGENTIDGLYYTSERSVMSLVIVDYVIMVENINPLDMSSAWQPDVPGMPSNEGGLLDYEGYTIVRNGSSGTIRVAIGNTIRLATEFLNGITIEYDTTNASVALLIRELAENITYSAEWGVVSDRLGVIGDYIKQTKLSPAVDIMSAYMRIVPEVTAKGTQYAITPLKMNLPNETAYYFTLAGEFKYLNGKAVFNKNFENKNGVYNLSTHFVTDVYSTGTESSAIPIYNYSELMNMHENGWYILMNDLYLPNVFEPINTAISGFNGNGYNIYLPTVWNISDFANVGLFGNVRAKTVLKNIIVRLESTTSIRIDNEIAVNFGFIAGENLGTITNCAVIADNYVTATVTISGQIMTITENYVAGIAGINNGYITNSRVEATLVSNANVSGFVGINQNLISSSYVKNSRIVNKSGDISNHTAGFVVRNGLSISSPAHISTSYVSGAFSDSVYSRGSEKIISSDTQVAGFVFDNFAKISDCYSNVPIYSNSVRTGFVFNNAGSIENTYSTSTFAAGGQTAYGYIVNNRIDANQGTLENCVYLLGEVNATVNKITLSGLKSLSEVDFSHASNFDSYIISISSHKTGGIWFYPSKTSEIEFVYKGNFPSFISGKPELVAPNILADTQRQLDAGNIKVDPQTGETSYAYYETRQTEGSIYNPFAISTAADLERIMLLSSNRNINTNYFRLVSLIDYEAEVIGNSQVYKTIFRGELEGNNMTLAGFVIDTKENLTSGGFFSKVGSGSTGEGYIKNLNLKPRYINLPNTSNVGALAGSLESGKIYNISVDGFGYEQEGLVIIGHYCVGGVIGEAKNNFTMKNIESSMSARASYTSITTGNNVGIYTNKKTTDVSYSGAVLGVANNAGTVSYVKVNNNIASLAEIAGLMFGKIGTNVTASKIDAILNENQFVKATVYGAVISGENCGTIRDVKISGEMQSDFFNFETVSPTAVGSVAGLFYSGLIENVESYVDLVWSENVAAAPDIVGGIVGEMLGGTLSNAKNGGKISIKKDSAVATTISATVGGIVGRISYKPTAILNSALTASNSMIYDCQTLETSEISVDTVSMHKVYIGGIIGETINTYENYIYHEENYVRAAYEIVLNKCANLSNINLNSIFYGGKITAYVGGLVGAAFSDINKNYGGEIIVDDEVTADPLNNLYASYSISQINVAIKDLSTQGNGIATLHFGGILGIGYPVNGRTEIKGTTTSIEFGQMLRNELKPGEPDESEIIVKPNYAGQYADEGEPIDMVDSDYLTINILLKEPTNKFLEENNYHRI